MKDEIIRLYDKYRELIQYLIFGVLTTIVNFVVYYTLKFIFGTAEGAYGVVFNTIANIIAIIFAYITNRIWVFKSEAKGFKAIMKEMFSFFSCRIATMLNDMFVYWFGCNVLHLNDFIVKCIAQVIIIVLNFILSKLIVFRKKKNTKEEEEKNEN